ncbi:DER1-domain-containing protein [Violaceomyces palustris]|uniref:DER1-domain-containing protein n=1 Tax=Violaceomyces palustris TaxID=1673888 RepID=A0ACD0P5W1_9BASI|nr:DER1-domain-containing protein [Violaceomyces palustris]
MEEIKKIPPVTRTLIFSTALVTVPCLLAIANPYNYLLWWPAIWKKYQVWRIYTSFFYGGSGLPLLFDTFLLYRNSSDLEINHFFRRTSSYVYALLIMSASILVLNYPLGSTVLFNPMLNALTYLWSRTNPHSRVSFFGLINCPAPWLPYAYLLLDLVRGGPGLVIQSATGLVSAHLYWFLSQILPSTDGGRGPRLVQTPESLQRLLPDSVDPSVRGSGIRTGNASINTSFGSVWAPRGSQQNLANSSFPSRGGGNTLSGGTSSYSSWLPSFLRSGNGGGSSRGGGGGEGGGTRGARSSDSSRAPSREEMLAAAEKRLRDQRANSIAGRNSSSPIASSNKTRTTATTTSLTSPVNGRPTPLGGQGAVTSGTSPSSGTSQPFKRNVKTNPNNMFTFNQLNLGEGGPEENRSSSGGKVAEERKPSDDQEDHPPSPSGKGKGKEVDASTPTSNSHNWGGSGQRLGD